MSSNARLAGAAAFAFFFGLQALRDLTAGVTYYLGWWLDAGMPVSALFVVGLTSLIFTAPRLRSKFGDTGAMARAGAIIAVSRLVAHVFALPVIDLAAAAAGYASFIIFIALAVGSVSGGGVARGHALGVGTLFGIALNTLMKGALGTLDLGWQPGFWAVMATGLLVAANLLWLRWQLRRDGAGNTRPPTVARSATVWLATLGPVLAAGLILFQNVGHVGVSAGLGMPWPLILTALANATGLVVASALPALGRRQRMAAVIPLLVAFFASSIWQPQNGGFVAALVTGQAAVASVLALSTMAIGAGGRGSRPSAAITGTFAAMTGTVLLVGAYFTAADTGMAVPRPFALPVAAAWLGVVGIAAMRLLPEVTFAPHLQPGIRRAVSAAPALGSAVLVLVAAAAWVVWEEPARGPGPDLAVRVVSYNIHHGFSGDGRPTLPQIADAIRDSEANVVALQEVSRGGVSDGGVDMLRWLGEELDMPYWVWGPVNDARLGNAILSRFPIVDSTTRPLPRLPRSPHPRAYTMGTVQLPDGGRIRVISTHLTHIRGASSERDLQLAAIVNVASGLPSTIIAGDLNAEPDSPELVSLAESGLQDAFAVARLMEPGALGFTSSAVSPERRIDYIWLSPDLEGVDFQIGTSRASDHLPVAVTVLRADEYEPGGLPFGE